jgi:type IV secretory pathway VirB2 component (pilin)
MSKKSIKIITAIVTFAMIMTFSLSVFALTPLDISPTDTSASSSVKTLGGKIMGVLQTAGIVVAVVILSVLGIKYMMGSASEKAEYKKTMIPYLIGAIFIFAAPTIANIVFQLAEGLKTV